MKRQERAKEVRKRAYEYAKSGQHLNWLSIEHQITSEGLPGAKSELDHQFIREELNSLCVVATSSEEIKRRQQFQTWLEDAVRDATTVLKNSEPDISLTVRSMTLYINGPSFSFEIGRRFGSNELEVTRVFKEADGQRYRTALPDRLRYSDFQNLKDEQAISLIEEFVRSQKKRGQRT